MNEKELPWRDAIIKVMQEESRALHYSEISDIIMEKGYRKSIGATPASTVNSYLTDKKYSSVFFPLGKGEYMLTSNLTTPTIENNSSVKEEDKSSKDLLIESFGIYWDRNKILWKNDPSMFGKSSKDADKVDFKQQIGIYVLYDHREVIYVGQAVKQSIVQRLYQHTTDRLSGRWNRFSWFGFYKVNNDATLTINKDILEKTTYNTLANALESILIECIEPRQNRKSGNDYGMEYIQFEDENITKQIQQNAILQQLLLNNGK